MASVKCKICKETVKYIPDVMQQHESSDHSLVIYPNGQMIHAFFVSDIRVFCLESRKGNPYFTGCHFKTKSKIGFATPLWLVDNIILLDEANCKWSAQKWIEYAKNFQVLK